MGGTNKFTGIDGKEYKVNWDGAEGFKVNNWFRSGTKDQLNKAIELFVTTGKMPTASDVGATASGWQEIQKDMKTWMDSQGIDENTFFEFTPEGIAQAKETKDGDPYYFRPQNINQAGTKENEMLDIYRQANEKTRELYDQENAQAEVDLMRELDGQRRKTLEDIRNRRRTMLKNGLSSAQIANEEIQSLMMSQNTNRMIGEQYIRERSNIRNTFNRNEANAPINVMNMMSGYNQSGTAAMAAKAGDADYMASLYRESLNKGRYSKDDYMNVVNPGGSNN